MARLISIVFRVLMLLVIVAVCVWWWVSRVPYPDKYEYGVSFNTPYARELGLDWKKTYLAILDELGVKHVRLAAHWPMIEPKDNVWNFTELDTQMQLAREHNADVILGVGRRLPRWPECHIPGWAQSLSWDEQKQKILEYVRTVVMRYKDEPALRYWQVENEPFLTVFAHQYCGSLDTAFLNEELALVRELDPSHPILVTDSGNLGVWYGAYRRGDVFGTSVYVYLDNPDTGPFKTLLPPQTYSAKRELMGLVYGKKDTLLIELSLEPWLTQSIVDTPLATQIERMPVSRMDEILTYARETKLREQYLWGAEWWYWMKATQHHPEYWDWARSVFRN